MTEIERILDQLKRAYEAAEPQAIDALATQLESAKTADCVAYNQLLNRARTVNSPRVITEATRRIRCVSPAPPPLVRRSPATRSTTGSRAALAMMWSTPRAAASIRS